jgi:hypothetical protein
MNHLLLNFVYVAILNYLVILTLSQRVFILLTYCKYLFAMVLIFDKSLHQKYLSFQNAHHYAILVNYSIVNFPFTAMWSDFTKYSNLDVYY